MLKIRKNILIYPYGLFSIVDGGGVALYQLASVLDAAGMNVRISGHHGKNINKLFNKFYVKEDFPIINAIVIYTEATIGNPLKAKKVVRWIMSEIGKIVPKSYVDSWGQQDLVYFFNSQPNLLDKEYYKPLTTFYINPIYINLGGRRSGTCYTLRKGDLNFMGVEGKKIIGPYFQPSKSLNIPIGSGWFEIGRNFNNYLEKFNSCKFFISYDPLTFMSFIAALCGCISIVNPCEGMDKEMWLKNTCFWPYLSKNGLNNISGIAYGMNDVQHAIETLPFLRKQLLDFCNFCKLEMVPSFIKDIKNFKSNLPNTVGTVFQR